MRASARRGGGVTLGPWVGASVVLHAAAITALVFLTSRAAAPLPPVYRVDIVAAPPGPRKEGVVVPEKTPIPPQADVPLPQRPQPLPTPPPVPVKPAPAQAAPPRATPSPKAVTPTKPTPQPKAGGGPQGGTGTDVANVHTVGVEFPFPDYLNNIVRQMALNFTPLDRNSGLSAEVSFVIHRDGSVDSFRYVKRSGDYGFDLEAQGAYQAAAKSFGPLPQGFHDDALTVVFSFDPQLIK
ncbi:MAG TPA: TonB family protein [Gemmatimonadaceae bacterium]|jgi:TonB family protein|nr:TonB family protein [Gemmatimonadaceae bacterium]